SKSSTRWRTRAVVFVMSAPFRSNAPMRRNGLQEKRATRRRLAAYSSATTECYRRAQSPPRQVTVGTLAGGRQLFPSDRLRSERARGGCACSPCDGCGAGSSVVRAARVSKRVGAPVRARLTVVHLRRARRDPPLLVRAHR